MYEFNQSIEEEIANEAKKTNILITGGAGYVGSLLTEMLVTRGFNVTVIDNLLYFQNPFFNLFHYPNFKFIFGDVTNENFMKEILSKNDYDYIFPLAAIVGFQISEIKPEITWNTNYNSILTLLKYRRKSKIIFPNTNSGYGSTNLEKPCTEETPLTPISTYGKSKAAAESAIMQEDEVICFRLATLFGFSPRIRFDLLVNDFVYKAVKDKAIVLFERKFKRNVAHVRDAVRGFIWAMINWDKMKNRIYNLGNPNYNITKEELALKIKEFIPELNIFYAEIGSDPDKRNYIVSNERLLSTGFEFKYSLEDGIQELIRGYSAYKDFKFKNY
jgi:nucleoside-diphosphate-sugar epimerase